MAYRETAGPFCAVKATEKSRMPAEAIESASCVQKEPQPTFRQESAARKRALRAASEKTEAGGGVSLLLGEGLKLLPPPLLLLPPEEEEEGNGA